MVNAFSFSYTPKPSTALASITPLKLLGEGREALRFTASTPMSFIKQNPEVVTEGFWKGRQALTEGIVKGGTSALSGITGVLAQKAADIKAKEDAQTEHERAKEIAKIKAAPTFNEELYKSNQLAIQNEQLRKLQTENNNVNATEYDSVAEGDTSVIDEIESLISPAAKKVESAPPTQPSTSVPPTSSAPPVAPAAPNAPVAPAGVSQFAPGDAGRGLFQFDQGTGTDVYGNVPPRQASMAFNLAPLQPTSVSAPTTTVASAPESAPARTIFGQNDNPNFVSVRDAIKNRSVVAAPTEPNLFSDISAITPAPVQESAGYILEGLQPPRQQGTLPETVGQITLSGKTSELVPVSGAEEKPLAGTPPVEPALPQAVPSEPALAATPEPAPERTQEEIVNQYVGLLTNKPYRGAGDARRAKQVLEKLGLKAEIEVEKGEKGTRLHYVKVVDEPVAKTAPEGFFTKKITDAGGNETYVYEPKIPVKQQIATFDNNIDKAKTLQETLTRIKQIAPSTFGVFGGAGGISGLMKYNPIANDARTTRALLDTVKGIVGFDELVALKAQGGTLGALSDKELDMLTSLKGSVNPDMDEKTFMDNINKMSESTARLISGLEADKKEVMKVESPTKFQPIQSEKPKYEKGVTSFVKDGYKYVWDGTEFKLSK